MKESSFYYVIESPILARLKLDVAGELLEEVPWVVVNTVSVPAALEKVDASIFGTVLIVDPTGEKPAFAISNKKKLAKQCFGKGKRRMLRKCRSEMGPCTKGICVLITNDSGQVTACQLICTEPVVGPGGIPVPETVGNLI